MADDSYIATSTEFTEYCSLMTVPREPRVIISILEAEIGIAVSADLFITIYDAAHSIR